MAQMAFNEVLTQARERKGYDLATVARRLRIRPDILRAIEAGDFNAMPPRGYTRNMVNAYARLLGLNPTEIVNMYLDEAYAVQVQRARDKAPGSGFDMSDANRRRPHLQTRGSRFDEDNMPISGRSRSDGAVSRDLYDDRTRFSRDDYGTTRARSNRSDKSDRDFSSHHSGYPSTGFSFMDEDTGRFARRRGEVKVGTTPMEYSVSRLPSFLQSRTALIIAGVVVVAIIILILTLVLGNGGHDESDDVTQLPVSGITDTTGEDDTSPDVTSKVAIAPTSAKVAYAAKSDDGCYVQIYVDGELSTEEMLDKEEKTEDVTGRWMIATYTPDNLTLTVDGEKKDLTANSDYDGMYTYTVDFDAILAEWEADHPGSTSSRRSSAADSTNSSNSDSSDENSQDAAAASDSTGADYADNTAYTDYSAESDNTGFADTTGYYDDGTGYYTDGTGYYDDGTAYYDDGTGTYQYAY